MTALGTALRCCIGGLSGAFIGFCVSVLVNSALVEISTNPFFAAFFGVGLILMGTLIVCRVWRKSRRENSPQFSTYFVVVFAMLVVLSGIFCFFVDIKWFTLSSAVKIPMYSLLGIALWFAFVFMILDVVNYFYQYVMYKINSKRQSIVRPQALVSTPAQIWLVLVMTTGLGVYFGLIFGLFKVATHLSNENIELYYTTPIGTLVCGFFGVVNQFYLASIGKHGEPDKYFKVNQEDEDEAESLHV